MKWRDEVRGYRDDWRAMWRVDPLRAAGWAVLWCALVGVCGMSVVWAALTVMDFAR